MHLFEVHETKQSEPFSLQDGPGPRLGDQEQQVTVQHPQLAPRCEGVPNTATPCLAYPCLRRLRNLRTSVRWGPRKPDSG